MFYFLKYVAIVALIVIWAVYEGLLNKIAAIIVFLAVIATKVNEKLKRGEK